MPANKIKKYIEKINNPLFIFYGLLFLAVIIGIRDSFEQVLNVSKISSLLWPFNDGDDWLRLVQTRTLIEGGQLYDHVIRSTNAPFGNLSEHWTRLMDFVLLLPTLLMPSAMILNQKLLLSASLVPPLLGVVSYLIILCSEKRTVGIRFNHFLLAAIVIFSTCTVYHFLPGNADHHALQVLFWCAILVVCRQEPTRRRSILAGLFLAASLWVSVEAVFFIALVYALFLTRYVYLGKDIDKLAALTSSCLVFTQIFLFAEIKPDQVFSGFAYDTLSVAHIIFLAVLTTLSFFLWAVYTDRDTLWGRFAKAFCASIFAAFSLFLMIPKFFYGPLVDIDPAVKPLLFYAVEDAQPFFKTSMRNMLWILPPVTLAIFLQGFFMFSARAIRWKDISTTCLFLAAFFLMSMQFRWLYYVVPVAVLIIVTRLLPVARILRLSLPKKIAVLNAKEISIIVFILFYGFFGGVSFMQDKAMAAQPRCEQKIAHAIQSGKLVDVLGNDKSLIIFAKPDVSGQIQFFTPYRVIAGLYHREVEGLSDISEISEATSFQGALETLEKRQVDVLLFCPSSFKPQSWLSQNVKGWKSSSAGYKVLPFAEKEEAGEAPILIYRKK